MKEEGSGASLSDNNISDGLQSQIGSSKIPDFWAKQFQLQQTQQFMYSYTMPNGGNMMQQQQLLPVPLSMPYGAHGSSQQQPYLYMQQAQQQSGSIPAGYSYELNNAGHSGDIGEGMHQLTRYGSQSGYPRQQQQLPQSREQGQRGGSWSGGNRNDKSRSTDNSSGSSSANHQQQDDLYIPLDNNGEISSRSSNQRPPEGEPSFFFPLPPPPYFPIFLRLIVLIINFS